MQPWGERPRDKRDSWEGDLGAVLAGMQMWTAPVQLISDGFFSFPFFWVVTAQLILKVEKGWNEKKDPKVRTDLCWEYETIKTGLWVWCSHCKDGFEEQKQFCLCYIKRRLEGTKALRWWKPFTISGSNSPYIGMSKNWVKPLQKVQQWDIFTYHNEVSYR